MLLQHTDSHLTSLSASGKILMYLQHKKWGLKMWMWNCLNLQDNRNSLLQNAGKGNQVTPPTLWTSFAALYNLYARGDRVTFKKGVTKFYMLSFGFVFFLNQSLLLLHKLLKGRQSYIVTFNLLLEYSLLEIGEDLLKGMQLEWNHSGHFFTLCSLL